MKLTKDELHRLYIVEEYSLQDIQKLTGVATTTLRKYLRTENIPIRPVGTKTERTRKRLSDAMTGVKNPNFGKKRRVHGCRCWYTMPDGRIVSMRSQWEVWYAQYLKEQNIEFKYEPRTFILNDGSAYTPDFLIVPTNEYVEVKGWLTEEHKKRIALFHNDYPQEKLILADKSYLNSIGIDLRKKWIAEKPMFPCEHCGELYHRSCPSQRFCCTRCRNKAISLGCACTPSAKCKRIYNGVQAGDKNNGCKLTESVVKEIKKLKKEGFTYAYIAEQTGASPGNIWNIIKGRSWKGVE